MISHGRNHLVCFFLLWYAMPDAVTTHDLMAEYQLPMDVFTYLNVLRTLTTASWSMEHSIPVPTTGLSCCGIP